MFLSKLDIFGFKSFYQKTQLNFTSGITSIVGPNGCGKTNVVDAMRWVLGEQRPTTLRMEKMESVIFNGTRKIRPLGMAEVSLTIDNTKGILPSEYSEITVTRRLFRSGESEYLINKSACRLRDIMELFMDSGIGFNAYSVIELKMIELILNDKTNERRKLFEEAAGITKYKHRRTSALRKLESVQLDLTRVQDIIVEVEKVVRSLERQAKKAEQYNKLTEELRGLEIGLIEREYNDIKIAIEPIKEKIDEIKYSKLALDTKLNRDEVDLESLRKGYLDLEVKLKLANQNLSDNNDEIKKIEHDIILQNERLKSLNQSIIRFENENDNLALEIVNLQTLIERDNNLVSGYSSIISEIDKKYQEKNEEIKTYDNNILDKKQEVEECNDRKIGIINEIASSQNKQSNLEFQVESIKDKHESFDVEIETASKEIEFCQSNLDDLEKQSDLAKKEIIKCELEFSQKENEKKLIQEDSEKLQKKSFEIQNEIGKEMSKIDFLKGLIEKNFGITESVQFLTRKSDWTDRPVLTITEAVNTDSKYRVAIEAGLTEFANYIIANDAKEAGNGIEILKKTNHGKATFVCLDTINKLQINENHLLNTHGIKASDVVKCDEGYKQLFKFLLNDVYLFEDLELARSFSTIDQNVCAITFNGEIFGGNGVIRGGGKRIDEGMLIGKKEQIKELADKVEEMREGLDNNQRLLQEKNDYFRSIDLKYYSEKINSAKEYLGEIERKIFELQLKKNNLIEMINKMTSEKGKLSSEKENLAVVLDETLPVLINLRNEQKLVEENLKRLNSELSLIEAERNLNNEELNDIKIQLVSQKSEVQNLQNEISRSEQNIEVINKNIERHAKEIFEFKESIQEIERKIVDENVILNDHLKKNIVLQNERDEAQNSYSKKRDEVNEIEKIIKQERKIHDESLNDLSELEIRYNELKNKAENLQVKAKDDYQFEIQIKLFEDINTFNLSEARDIIRSAKEKINSLGPVNLLAFSEYQTEKERLDFLTTQKDDLLESEKSLMETIDEINTTAKDKFDSTFELIRTNFIKVFKTLFDEGDECDLKFREEIDPLEGEVEIIAKPRGKRPQSIDSLSGGEKTLTALSLLFAIYLVKPSPFCILDEVDAPLDDANVDRYIKILRNFSDNTQFIVVTHNKRTMAAADTLYGVTMEEEGVSKLVAVQFNEEINLN